MITDIMYIIGERALYIILIYGLQWYIVYVSTTVELDFNMVLIFYQLRIFVRTQYNCIVSLQRMNHIELLDYNPLINDSKQLINVRSW